MDFAAITQMMQDPEVIARLSGQQTEAVQLEHLPVPVRTVQPDIVLTGEMNLRITFKPWMLVAKTEQDIKDMVWAVIYGTVSPDLPELAPYNLKVYREEVVPNGGPNGNLKRADTVPGLHDQGRGHDAGGTGNPDAGAGNPAAEAVGSDARTGAIPGRAGGILPRPADGIPADDDGAIHDSPAGAGDNRWSGPAGVGPDGDSTATGADAGRARQWTADHYGLGGSAPDPGQPKGTTQE